MELRDSVRYGHEMALDFRVPAGVLGVVRALEAAGFEAVLVGGCVRDVLMGIVPHDFDVATQATPAEVGRVFAPLGIEVDPTGIDQGGVTVRAGGEDVEVTTYRIDGAYLDQRHCEVTFTRSLVEDLRRRDFTINAMALAPSDDGRFLLVDAFHGEEDLARGLIRCVGEPARRFSEDPLRLMRAVRFVARLGFELEPATHAALIGGLSGLDTLSLERKTAELVGTLAAPHAGEALLSYKGLFFRVLPELAELDGFDQHSPWHAYDVWGHTARVVGALEKRDDEALLLAALLHDCAKPDTFTLDEDGRGHFVGHDRLGAEKAGRIMRARLSLPAAVVERVEVFVRFHELQSYNLRVLTRLARRVGEEVKDDAEVFDVLEELLWLRRADVMGQGENEQTPERLARIERGFGILERMCSEGVAIRTRDLAIGGKDVMALGVPKGPEVGRVLKGLLDLVVAGEVANEREALEDAARRMVEGAS